MNHFLNKFLTKSEQEKLSQFSRKVKEELASLPVISAISDATQGYAGLHTLQRELEQNPNDPLHWLMYYEAFMTYSRINSGVSVGRAIINPIGYIAGKGLSVGLNTLDDQYEAFDPKTCLGMIIALTKKKIDENKEQITSKDFIILSKAIAYSASFADQFQKEKMLTQAIQYITLAIEMENDVHVQAESFYYLAYYYGESGNKPLQLRALNVSRKLGFEPADTLLKDELKRLAETNEEKEQIVSNETNLRYFSFLYTYQPETDSRIENMWNHVKEQQQKKFEQTKQRISHFMKNNF